MSAIYFMKKKLKELRESRNIDVCYYLEKAEEAAKIREMLEASFWIMLAKEKAKKERVDISANIKNIKNILKNRS